MNAQKYLELLEDLRGELDNNPDLARIEHFQQDGAPSHFGVEVRRFLDEQFGDWIGRRGKVEWPARSPDLTPLDFAFWSVLKDKVFSERPRNIPHLRMRIEEECEKLRSNTEFFRKICFTVAKHMPHLC